MVTTIIYVSVLHEYIDAFITATEKNHEQSVKEDGNLRFDFLQNEEEPGSFVLYEAYEDEEKAAAHKSTSHYLEWRETVAPMMAEPRKGVRYTGLKP
ncbi:MAG: antibiotic biosynthesis monooxygenase [Bacteroidales bacterium]|nr:antibiotic biosynthesis monooxygenase [Bacteroidales bacterium]